MLRNSNIGQPHPSDMQEQDEDQPHAPAVPGGPDEPFEDDAIWLAEADLTLINVWLLIWPENVHWFCVNP